MAWRRSMARPEARELLHYAALLHDIGSAIGFDGHGDHSRYVILNGRLRGLSGEEVAVVANVARYHRAVEPESATSTFGR
jgi:exopolyphosphatase/guanosine-5'-triphosphate,3'-diphosphate pyrophosphatase